MAFIDGKADPWGMVVNPSYKGVELPTIGVAAARHLRPDVATSSATQQNPAPYFTQIAAPVTSLRKIAEAVLDALAQRADQVRRANVAPTPGRSAGSTGRAVGTRFMLGIVSPATPSATGFDQAALETAGATYVGPTPSAMATAIRTAEPSTSGDAPFILDMPSVVKAHAYPGTMIVYTAARTANLPAEDASKVAEFVRISTTEGQKAGYGNGELPGGYLPITKAGVTAPLWKQAQTVATAIAAQKGAPGTGGDGEATGDGTGSGSGSGSGSGTGSGTGGDLGPGSVTSVDDTGQDPAASGETGKDKGKDAGKDTGKDTAKTDQEPVAMPPTVAVASPVAERILPLLLLVTLISAIAANLIRLRHLRRRRA